MPSQHPAQLPIWKELSDYAGVISRPGNHLRHMITHETRLKTFSRSACDLLYDFSRQRVDSTALALLLQLAQIRQLRQQLTAMAAGAPVNSTEKRAALHMACRNFSNEPLEVDGRDVMADIRGEREKIRKFSAAVHSGRIKGSTGKSFRHFVVIGIGGSYLGTEFVSRALKSRALPGMTLHFLSNVDIHNFGEVVSDIDPESTLWIVISKSYTTPETAANTRQAYAFMEKQGLDPSQHVVTVTSKGSPGDDPSNPVLETFYMYDFIGGRYSVTSAVGGVPLSLYLGYECFERFLKGAHQMDIHAIDAPADHNLPLLAALISVWNNNFLGYPAQALIAYAEPLSKLAPHVQQLYMESNGKSVTAEGSALDIPTGVIIFGEPGTNAQHSFFQLAHQGRPFPVDFIGVIHPDYEQYPSMTKGVTNHQELWANLISQPRALAEGKEDSHPAKQFSGNRPSSTLILKDLSPENIGRLLAFYEARTVYEAFIWGINPFDQFGVELGKILASDIRKQMAARNTDPRHRFEETDPISRFYLEMLFSGEIPDL